MTPVVADQHRLTLTMPYDDQDVVCAWLFSAGATGIVTSGETITAWFLTPTFQPTPLPTPVAVKTLSPSAWSSEPHVDWQAAFVATIKPVTVGRFLITPSWLADEHPEDADQIRLIIDPAQAFGSGHHATTSLCIELLTACAPAGSTQPWHVADVGCGTGVLGIAAAKLGAVVEAVGTDPVAVAVTNSNATNNNVTLTTAVGSVAALTTRPHTLVANLLSDTIIALAGQLVAAPTKELIVSGISQEHFARVRATLEPLIGPAVTVREKDGWVAATFATAATR